MKYLNEICDFLYSKILMWTLNLYIELTLIFD